MRRLLAIGILAIVGCSESSDPGRYIPSSDLATRSLELALTACCDGAATGTVPGASNPAIEFVDTHRPIDRKLRAFAILSQTPGEGPREFIVKLTLDGPIEDQKVRYIVYGRDPVWVIRQEDYVMLNHWSHAPGTK